MAEPEAEAGLGSQWATSEKQQCEVRRGSEQAFRAAVVGSTWRRAKAAGGSRWETEGTVRVRSRVSSLGGVVMDTGSREQLRVPRGRAGQGKGRG